ncbi:MAG: alkaline phosphatase family protein [Leptospirales bacterium]|nr:alkaline phosphatase family protein [Leptospirales bacterium]
MCIFHTRRVSRTRAWPRFAAVLVALIFLAGCKSHATPRLLVVISIDQFRADYLRRFEDLFLPARSLSGSGGFRYLMEQGAYFEDAHQDHLPLYTAPGHSVILTGASPYKSGIVGNDWYDRKLGRRRYAVEDCTKKLVGTPWQTCDSKDSRFNPGISPAALRVSTLGDQMKLHYGRRAKVWGLALKDRAAVLMAGHTADGVIWFDDNTGFWISSTAYFPEDRLPDWLSKWNAKRTVDSYFGKKWELSVPPASLDRLWKTVFDHANSKLSLGTRFPHHITAGLVEPDKNFYTAFTISPFGNEYVFQTAREIIEQESLGKDGVPDLLTMSLSSNDHAGHQYGPDSPEVLDVTVRTDRLLAEFFRFLDSRVGLSNVIIVVTADHGVSSNSKLLREMGMPAGIYSTESICNSAREALQRQLGPGEWIYGKAGAGESKNLANGCVEETIYLNRELLSRRNIPAERAEQIVREAIEETPGIYTVFTRSQILKGQVPRTNIGERILRSYHPSVSADVIYLGESFWTPSEYTLGATHGSAYNYDTTVPLLIAGQGVEARIHTERVSIMDLAPTLASRLHTLQPSGADGKILDLNKREP